MHLLDYVVLVGYFLTMMGIGFWVMRRVQVQEDYFMGGRSFGKLLQAFAAFGAGTGSSDPVNTANTTFMSGLSGMWSVMYWLFVTPFYWVTGVWYRRMRHLTLGDWFVERYQSQRLGVAYTVFGILFFMVYGSMMFSAIGKVAAPLIGYDQITILGNTMGIEYFLVPVIGVVVLLYGIAGGLEAAYYTDLIQGICVIFLSIVLIPFGLSSLVERFGDPATQNWLHGFVIMHEQIPESYFNVVGSTSTAEFPLHRIVAVVIINLVGIVVQPHFIATGGGSAKTENNARVGLVVGNFLKRFCTVGWVLTSLIAVALFADNIELIKDPQRAWGVASRELLGPGLTGLMLACLFAALMSSVDAYMVVGSALVVRNVYVPFFDPSASEKRLVGLARVTGALIVAGAVLISLSMMNVLETVGADVGFPGVVCRTVLGGDVLATCNADGGLADGGVLCGDFFCDPVFLRRSFHPTCGVTRPIWARTRSSKPAPRVPRRRPTWRDAPRESRTAKSWHRWPKGTTSPSRAGRAVSRFSGPKACIRSTRTVTSRRCNHDRWGKWWNLTSRRPSRCSVTATTSRCAASGTFDSSSCSTTRRASICRG